MFILYAAINEENIWKFMAESIKGNKPDPDVLNWFGDTAIEYSLERQLDNFDDLTSDQYVAVLDAVQEKMKTSKVVDVEFMDKAWNENTRDVDITYDFDVKELVKETLKREVA